MKIDRSKNQLAAVIPAESVKPGESTSGGKVSPAQVLSQGSGPVTVPSPGPTPTALAEVVGRKTQLVERYAALGLFRLAERKLAEANEAMRALDGVAPSEPAGPHLGLLPKGLGPLRDAARGRIEDARQSLDVERTQPIPPLGPPPWKKTVLLFGSSVNPPTGRSGHEGIVSWGARHEVDVANDKKPEDAREQVPIDEVWVLPVYRHLFTSKSNLLPFEDRFHMAELAFHDLPGLEGRVQVKDTERQVVLKAVAAAQVAGQPPESARVGTIDIIRHLEAEHPDTKFVLALGADTYQDLLDGKWKEGDRLLQNTEIVVVPREGVSGVSGFADGAPKLGEVSSTKIRASSDLSYLSDPDTLHPKVLEYMRANKLYGFAEEK